MFIIKKVVLLKCGTLIVLCFIVAAIFNDLDFLLLFVFILNNIQKNFVYLSKIKALSRFFTTLDL